MKSFKENLELFEESQGFSDLDIIELAEINDTALEQVKEDPLGNRKILYKLCLGLELDFSTLFDDKGFKCKSLTSQYSQYPEEYKKIVTKGLFSYISTKLRKIDFKELITSEVAITPNYLARLCSGSSFIKVEELRKVRVAVSEYISDYMLDEHLAKVMYDKVINYNYNIAKFAFNLSYSQIAEYISRHQRKRSIGCVSNWGGFLCASMPRAAGELLAKAFGDTPIEIFSTRLMKDSDFRGKQCLIASSDAETHEYEDLPDPIEILRYSSKAGIVIPTAQEMGISMGSAKENKLNFNDDKVEKMFNNLTDENRTKVTEFITELFFSQL